jgi:hypothetical protein
MTKTSKRPARKKGYWFVERDKHLEPVFRRRLPGNLSSREISTILERLASTRLTADEVISASLRKPRKTALLEVCSDGRIMWMPTADLKAFYRREDEIAGLPDISPPA